MVGKDLNLYSKSLLYTIFRYLPLIFFFPLYFTPKGIYQASNISGIYSEGIVLSSVIFLMIFITLILLFSFLKGNKIRFITELTELSIQFYLIIFILIIQTFLGYLIYKNITIFVVNFQFIIGLSGMIISYYFIFYLNYRIDKVLLIISSLFLFAMFSNLIVSFNVVGITGTISRNIWPSTFFGGIYHHFIYYPYLVSQIFLLSFPIWKKILKKYFFLLYIFILFYILIFQVRGAIISFVLGSIIYIMIYHKITIKNFLIIFISIALAIFLLPKDFIVGRFTESLSQMLGHRTSFLPMLYSSISSNPLYLFIGSVSKANFDGIEKNIIFGIFSFHNQYLNIFDNYGLFISIFIFYFYFRFLKIIYLKSKLFYSNTKNIIFIYWLLIILVTSLIDFNINEIISTANPSIYIVFLWSMILFSLFTKQNSEITNSYK